jgi:branched-chain amino acid transport system substrate-binding protein
MRPPVAFRVAVAVVTAYGLAGCSSAGEFAGEDEAGPPTATIVVLAPEGNESAARVADAVRLAVDDRGPVVAGWTLSVVAVDASDVAATVYEVAADDQTVAVVGGLSGRAVRVLQPVLEDASILFVSPADVAPEHTRGADPADPWRPYATYFRTAMVPADAVDTAARYAVDGLGAQRIAVVDASGSDDSLRFAGGVRLRGAEIVASGPVGTGGLGIERVIATSVSKRADAVYTTGDTAVAVEIAGRLARAGLDVPLIGGSALRSKAFLTGAGSAADGAVAVVAPASPPDATGRADELVARLAERGIEGEGLAAAAYDAGAALAEALHRCLPAHATALAARAACVAEMQHVSVAGVTGEIAFDAFGDRAGTHPDVYQVRDGGWVELDAG